MKFLLLVTCMPDKRHHKSQGYNRDLEIRIWPHRDGKWNRQMRIEEYYYEWLEVKRKIKHLHLYWSHRRSFISLFEKKIISERTVWFSCVLRCDLGVKWGAPFIENSTLTSRLEGWTFNVDGAHVKCWTVRDTITESSDGGVIGQCNCGHLNIRNITKIQQ